MRINRAPNRLSFGARTLHGFQDLSRRSAQDVRFSNPVRAGTRLRLGEDLFLVTKIGHDGHTGTVKPLLTRAGVKLAG